MRFFPVVAALGALVLERLPDGRFRRRTLLPDWCQSLDLAALHGDAPFVVEDAFPFLSAFLPEVERSLAAAPGRRVDSGFWTELGKEGEELHLEASAVPVNRSWYLIVQRDERRYAEQQLLLQRAREVRLTHRSLMRETEMKDVLVHAIVHDLAAPLHGILGAVSLLAEQPLGEQAMRWVQVAQKAAERQRELISDILSIFSAESGELTARPDPAAAPDLARAVAQVVEEAEPAGRARGVTVSAELGAGPWRVLAEESRLVRVLANLVDNALRHSPQGGRVVVSAHRTADAVRVEVEDDGPGVEAAVLPHLFERLVQGRKTAGAVGLGLYFCRITVERWGGGIGYERREEGGSRFWVRLLGATPSKESHGSPAAAR